MDFSHKRVSNAERIFMSLCQRGGHNSLPFIPQIHLRHVCYKSRNLGWALLRRFPPFHYFPNFQHCQITCLLLNITLIFHMCYCSAASVTPVKYELDSKNVTSTFTRLKVLLMEKLTNGALVTPTPALWILTCALWISTCVLWISTCVLWISTCSSESHMLTAIRQFIIHTDDGHQTPLRVTI